MGTIQRQFSVNPFRAICSIGAIAMMNGGSFRGRKIKDTKLFGKMFGDKPYTGSPRLMLTLPPIKSPVARTEEQKARKRANRQAKRQRIETRGY